MCNDDISKPNAAPINPARLHPPWKVDMMGLLYADSNVTACVFTDMLQKLPKNPKIIRLIINAYSVADRPTNSNASTYPASDRGSMFLLPTLDISNPEMVIPQIWPMGIIRSIVPQAASPRWSVVFISGILLAQLEKHTPVQKYKQKMAKRMRPFDAVISFLKMFINRV